MPAFVLRGNGPKKVVASTYTMSRVKSRSRILHGLSQELWLKNDGIGDKVPGEGRASAAGWRNLAYIAEIRWSYNCFTSYGHALPGAQRCPAMHRILHHAGNGQYFCSICNEPVKLETAKADEDGHPVHEDCYLDKLSGKIPLTVRKPPATQS